MISHNKFWENVIGAPLLDPLLVVHMYYAISYESGDDNENFYHYDKFWSQIFCRIYPRNRDYRFSKYLKNQKAMNLKFFVRDYTIKINVLNQNKTDCFSG